MGWGVTRPPPRGNVQSPSLCLLSEVSKYVLIDSCRETQERELLSVGIFLHLVDLRILESRMIQNDAFNQPIVAVHGFTFFINCKKYNFSRHKSREPFLLTVIYHSYRYYKYTEGNNRPSYVNPISLVYNHAKSEINVTLKKTRTLGKTQVCE